MVKLFKPKIQDARRAAETVPKAGAKLAGLPWELLADALLSIQMSIFQKANWEQWEYNQEQNLEAHKATKEDTNYTRMDTGHIKYQCDNILTELTTAGALAEPTFRSETERSFGEADEKLDNIFNLLSLAAGKIEEIPTEPPPPPPPDEACMAMARAMEALSKKQFKVDYLLIKKMVTEAIQPTLAKVNQIDSRTITIESDVKKLGKNGNDSVDLKPVHERLIKLSTDIKEVKKDTAEVKEAFKAPVKGSVRLWVKDKKPKLVPYEGKGIAGIASFLNAIENQNFHIQELMSLLEVGEDSAVPETWHGKALDAVPQLILKYAIQPTNGNRGKANYKVTIPHYAGVKLKTAPIPVIFKGNYYAIITLKDGTKCTTYCQSFADTGKFINSALKLIPKEWHKKPLDFTQGVRSNVQRKRLKLVCRGAVFLSQGSKSPAPDWTVDFP